METPKDKTIHIGLRIDSETLAKLKSLAEYEGRSSNILSTHSQYSKA